MKNIKQRLYASLIILGAGFLTYRTITLIFEGAFAIFALWVFLLLVAELLVDLGCVISALPWLVSGDPGKDQVPLRFGAAAALLHAIRVFIYAFAKVGPWPNFDVRPLERSLQYTRWTWGEVYFASIMAVLGVLGVLVIWGMRLRAKRQAGE